MATVTKPSPFGLPAGPTTRITTTAIHARFQSKGPQFSLISFTSKLASSRNIRARSLSFSVPTRSSFRSLRLASVVPHSFQGDSNTGQVTQDPEIEDSSGEEYNKEDSAAADEEQDDASEPEIEAIVEESDSSALLTALKSYNAAVACEDSSKIAEIESFVKSFEEEKCDLESKFSSMEVELSAEKDRVLRISADFDNFRKRTERERLSLVTNAQGQVVETLLGVLDNFERAKAQIKIETEAEEKINNSYQSIYKQFVEILGSLGVVPVETVGKPFDPALHEAIMREDSSEFAEGIILEEFRKGFKLGERLLRPSMVKVSSGPGPAQPEENSTETSSESNSEPIENATSVSDSP